MTMAEKFDLLIKDAKVIDGTGKAAYKSDVGIIGEQVAAIEKKIDIAAGKRVISADGLVVSPGFLDTHTHDDIYLLFKPTCDDKILQGVTTVIIGNCGFSIAPIANEHRNELMALLEAIGTEYLPRDTLDINTFGQALEKLEASKPGINIGSLVGHTNIRIAAMGNENRAPTDDELNRMKKMTAEAMAAGAFGLSTGLIYAPGNFANTDEIIELAAIAGGFNGLYVTHLRSESEFVIAALKEALKIGEAAAVPVHISHHKIFGKNNWGNSRKTLALIMDARNRGIRVTCDQYPYRAGCTFLAAVLPPSVLAGGDDLFIDRLKESKFRAHIIDTIEHGTEGGWENMLKGDAFDDIFITVAKKHKDYIGRSIAAIARMENKSPYDVIFDLIIAEKWNVIATFFVIGEDDIVNILRSPITMVGSDGIPGFEIEKTHPRQTGTFPRILGRYVRERKLMPIEEAVRRMTSLPAKTFGLKKKGLLKKGFDADLVIFDPETIIDRSTYEDPNKRPVGISYVLVNGQIAVENGVPTGATSGKILKTA